MLARRGIVQLARLGCLQLACRQMQTGHVANRRLGLMRDQFGAMRLGERRAAHQPGDAAHLDDVGLDHADPRVDQIRYPRQCVGLLTGRDGNVEAARYLAHRFDMVMLDWLFEPPIAQFFERPPDADRAADRVAIIGVEGER